MYFCTGCKLPEDFEASIRGKCLELNRDVGLDTSGFSLPQHISLKISFDAGDRYPQVLDAIGHLLRREPPITVHPTAIESHGGILWITFRENAQLRRLHNLLDRELEREFGIRQHLFDKAFLFHSALFVGNEQDIREMGEKLADYPLPESLEIDTFAQGLSEVGKSGTYRVVREIKV